MKSDGTQAGRTETNVFTGFHLFSSGRHIIFPGDQYWDVVEGDRWRSEGDSLFRKYMPIEAERGNILSDDGSFLATSLKFFDIRVDLNSTGMRAEVFNKNIDSLAICLSHYVDPSKSVAYYKNHLIKKRKEGSRWLTIKRNASYRELAQIKKFPLFRLGQHRGGVDRRAESDPEKTHLGI